MGEEKKPARQVCLNYCDLVDGFPETEYQVELQEFDDGTVRLLLDDKPAHLSIEMLGAWSYTLINWRNRIEKDLIKGQPKDE